MPMRVSGMVSGLDTESIVSELVKSYKTKGDTYTKAQTKLSWKQDAWKDLNKKIYSLYTNVSNLRFDSAYTTRKATVSDNTKASVTASGNAVNGTQKLSISSIAQTAYMTGGVVGTKGETKATSTLKNLGYTDEDTTLKLKVGDETKEIKLSADDKLSDVAKKFQEAGLNANFDENQSRFYISAKKSGAGSDFEISADGENANKVLNLLGMNTEPVDGDSSNTATKLDGKDAQITLNGVTYTSDTNNFEINGLSITANAPTTEDITITTDTDTQAIYDKIKDFLTQYNTVMNEMCKLYNADSAKGYEPLTDDEKNEMSDTEIEKWETKIKDSLLRRDTTLNSVMSGMISSMNAGYEINGTKYSLSSFGISTMGYLNAAENENYAYHIDGDADDENTSGKTDKLMAAIKNNPDDIISFMKQLTTGLYKGIDAKMKSTSMSSAYTVYNDKQMDSQYKDYTKLISEWEDKVSAKEDYYYKKFSSMEAAMSKLNSQSSSFTNMFS